MKPEMVRRDPWGWMDLVPNLFRADAESGGMRVEEYRDGDTLVVKADMPGIDPDKDVQITVSEGRLRIRAERREESEHKDKDSYRSEVRYGSFMRDLAVPSGVSTDDIKASYKDGVLMVRIPWPASTESQTKTVPVTRE